MKYYDIRERSGRLRALNIVIGGRGIGKSYSALSFALEQSQPFIYLRNTAVQMEESCTQFGNPFKRINKDFGRGVYMAAEKRHYIIYEDDEEKGRKLLGYGAALSTFANLRGVDLSDVTLVIFDEFIERRRLSFNQFQAFVGFYETVNRNRELQGEEPLKVILLSNSQTLDNDILSGYGLVQRIVDMKKSGTKTYMTSDLYLELPDSDISEAKANTANYRLIAGSAAAREALSNEFAYDNFGNIEKKNLNEYRPLCRIDTGAGYANFWKHKSRSEIYVCGTCHSSMKEYAADQSLLFDYEYGIYFRQLQARKLVYFDSFQTKQMVDKLFNC